MVKRFGYLTCRLFGHPEPDSTAHFVHPYWGRVLQHLWSDCCYTCRRHRSAGLNVLKSGRTSMQRVENSFRADRSFSVRQTGSRINTQVSLSLAFPPPPRTRYTYDSHAYNFHTCDRCLYFHVFKCEPTYSVIVVEVIRLHSSKKNKNIWILYSPILKLNYIVPNKYWSIFISIPTISSWDSFRTTDMVIHHRYIFFSIHERILHSSFYPSLWRQNKLFHATFTSTIHSLYDLCAHT